jgi:carboxypeptidase PM20D1
MKRTAVTLLLAVGVLGGIILVRTARFSSHQLQDFRAPSFALDMDAIAQRLSKAIQIKTLSQPHPVEENAKALRQLREFLGSAFPRVHKHLDKEIVSGHSLLFAWKGKESHLAPMLLMGHIDVVPVDPNSDKKWTHPPFAGRIAEGYIWGRGAMDDKASVMGILEAVEYLLAEGFAPQRTIYFAFGHDEETGGEQGAARIAELLHGRGVALEFVLDEGMNIVHGIIPGAVAPVALIGIAEKGYLSLELSVETPGGHASLPPARTAIGILSSAIDAIERAPLPSRLAAPTRKMLESIAPAIPFHKRIILANLWLFDPLLRAELAKSPLTDATIRTTQATTIFHAGVEENILPAKARAVVNFRILPGDSAAAIVDHVRKQIADPRVKITPRPAGAEPSPVSDTESTGYRLLKQTIQQIAPEVIVAPSLLVAATDSRHYARLTNNIFRFVPITLRAEDAQRYHGIDERIAIEDYRRCVRFYLQLMRNASGERR